jgi:PadR family transcriptional regulator, regulatory protein PadR
MPKGGRYANRIDLLQGTLDLIILETLRWGPQHGYAISQAINANSRQAFKAETGSLYPALHRLEKQGWVTAEWGVTENKQRARIYRLTAAGHRQLSAERSRWEQFVRAMATVLKSGRKAT